jgi:orotidine-5'-phosphate decarboxylase
MSIKNNKSIGELPNAQTVENMSFRQRMKFTTELKQSHIVLALDFPFLSPESRKTTLSKAQAILDMVAPYICAVKINGHLTLPLGLFDGVKKLIQQAHNADLQLIMDCKLNDNGDANQVMAEYYFDAGFDALTASPFIGWEEGIKPIFITARKNNGGVILLTCMGHKSVVTEEYEQTGYEQTILDLSWGIRAHTKQHINFARKNIEWKADGALVNVNDPEKIKELYDILEYSDPIYLSDLVDQGWSVKEAIKAGATYLIVEKAIIGAEHPRSAANRLKFDCEQALLQRKSDETKHFIY